MAKVVSCSETVIVFVGKENQVFSVHIDLIALRSEYFSNRFREAEDDEKVALPNINPFRFADFVSWIYSGEALKMGSVEKKAFTSETCGDELWALVSFLKAPGFQNQWIDEARCEAETEPNNWIYISSIESAYQLSKPGSSIRKFNAGLMSFKNPFKDLKEGSKAWKDWYALLDRVPDLSKDIVARAVKQWNGYHPWDEQYRASYMEPELPLEEKWEQQLLAKRSRAEIESAAKSKCLHSIIALDNLDRGK